MKVKDLERNVRDTLNDQAAQAYSHDLVIRGINQGARAIVSIRPDAATKYEAILLTANQSHQVLPAASNPHRLLDITHNMGADGNTPGPTINRVKRVELDRFVPDWHSATGTPYEWVFDDRDSTRFFVHPHPTSPIYVMALFSYYPADVEKGEDNIDLKDGYMPALEQYVLWHCWRGDRETSPNMARADHAWQVFQVLMGTKLQADAGISPKAGDQDQ